MKRKRSATVEPVWGTLINFLGLRRMTSRGLKCANQALLVAAACYNLKKYMKHITQKVKTVVMSLYKTEEASFVKRFFLYDAHHKADKNKNQPLIFLQLKKR